MEPNKGRNAARRDDMTELYRIEKLTFTYPDRENRALSDVDFSIGRGEFLTLCGPSGGGKTTLLRHLKPSTIPHGARTGEVFFAGAPIGELPARDAAAKIGFVLQSPDNQIVTDKVWHELAFGLESLGLKTPEIRLRVAEMASFFGIQTWFHRPVAELSGGQKQMLALASIMALQPSALILDEPTSQLDPIAAGEFLATIGKINRDLGVTVILTEHRLEEAFPLSTRALVMDGGRIIADGTPRDVGLQLRGQDHGMFLAMPTPMRVWASCTDTQDGLPMRERQEKIGECPITVRDGASWLDKQKLKLAEDRQIESSTDNSQFSTLNSQLQSQTAVELDDVWFKYEKDMPDVIKGLSFKANFGEFTAILGGNGAGKTTTLSLIAGLYSPYRGKLTAHAQVYALPQDPQTLFVAKTVREDLLEGLSGRKMQKEEKLRRLAAMVKLCRLEDTLDCHPYDLSGGEQQRAALAKVLLLQPKILLLDEPTKGLDAEFKLVFAAILKKLASEGVAVVMASHDVEFCARHADKCALFFDGNIVAENSPREFFAGNSFYTTSANRMARGVLPYAITADDIVAALGGNVQPGAESIALEYLDADTRDDIGDEPLPLPPKPPGMPLIRKIAAGAFTLLLLATFVFAGLNFDGFKSFISGGSEAVTAAAEGGYMYVGIMIAAALEVIGIALALTWKREAHGSSRRLVLEGYNAAGCDTGCVAHRDANVIKQTRKLSKRTIAAAVIILLTIPLTIYIGIRFLDDRRFFFISILIILQTMLPFALVFEGRKPQARELVIIAVLCAIGVAGRAVFFMLPQFRPVIALVVIAGVAFGGEAGFFVGAMTMLVSNIIFQQGPWTPYQMFAAGIIGFLAGALFRKGMLNRSRLALCIFGGLSTFIIYGGIMNPAQVMIYQGSPTPAMFLAAYLQGVPMDLVHAAATVVFLIIISQPMLEKLDRIKVKYGLVE